MKMIFQLHTHTGPSLRRFFMHLYVLVLRGSRLFVPTFLLRLTAHDQPGHMDFNMHLANTSSIDGETIHVKKSYILKCIFALFAGLQNRCGH